MSSLPPPPKVTAGLQCLLLNLKPGSLFCVFTLLVFPVDSLLCVSCLLCLVSFQSEWVCGFWTSGYPCLPGPQSFMIWCLVFEFWLPVNEPVELYVLHVSPDKTVREGWCEQWCQQLQLKDLTETVYNNNNPSVFEMIIVGFVLLSSTYQVAGWAQRSGCYIEMSPIPRYSNRKALRPKSFRSVD